MDWEDFALVGRIARAHGNRGQVIVNPETDFAETRFRAGARLFMRRGGAATPVIVTSVRFQRGRPILALEGVDTMDAAEALAGEELRVPAAELAPLPEGTFYHHDLVGCRAETREGETIGIVKAVEGATGGSRLVIEGARGEILVPLVTDICPTIDVAKKRIVVDAPEGLLDLNE